MSLIEEYSYYFKIKNSFYKTISEVVFTVTTIFKETENCTFVCLVCYITSRSRVIKKNSSTDS